MPLNICKAGLKPQRMDLEGACCSYRCTVLSLDSIHPGRIYRLVCTIATVWSENSQLHVLVSVVSTHRPGFFLGWGGVGGREGVCGVCEGVCVCGGGGGGGGS